MITKTLTCNNCKEIFYEHDWRQMVQEIEDCKHLGMDCDKNTWFNLRNFCLEQLKQMEVNKK